MTRVKICGITNLADARGAMDAGADMLGFILYPESPRYISPERAAEITREVHAINPGITLVGVFVNETAQHIAQALLATGLDLAQLSGDETPQAAMILAGRAYKAIRTLAKAQPILGELLSQNAATRCPDLLLDADHPALYGGSGQRADESLAVQLAHRCRLLLAGGLKPDNVADVIRLVQPWGVDVASGVEAAPGRKDLSKVNAFIKAVREQDNALRM